MGLSRCQKYMVSGNTAGLTKCMRCFLLAGRRPSDLCFVPIWRINGKHYENWTAPYRKIQAQAKRVEFQCFALSCFAVFAAGFLFFVSGNSTLVQTTEINARSEFGTWNLGRMNLPTLSDWCCMIPRRFWGAWASGEDRDFCYDCPSVLT